MVMSDLGSLSGGGTIDSILRLMQGQGEIQAQQAREKVAQDELSHENQHPIARNYLHYFGMIAPWLVPGGGIAAGLVRAGISAGTSAALQAHGNDPQGIDESSQMANLLWSLLHQHATPNSNIGRTDQATPAQQQAIGNNPNIGIWSR